MSPDRSTDSPLHTQGVSPSPEALEDALFDALDGDERLQSGVPEAQRTTDLDFIQMTGLGHPAMSAEEPLVPPPADPGELDARRPLSFFEKGVADVDASMAPPALDAEDPLAGDLVPLCGSAGEEPPPTVILPAATPAAPTERASRTTLETGDSDVSFGQDLRAASREASLAAVDPVPEDDLAELSQAVERLKAAPKPPPFPRDEEWLEPKSEIAPPEPPLRARDLAEAEHLLQELEHQPRDVTETSATHSADAKEAAENDASVYRQPSVSHRRHSSRSHTRLQRRLVRWLPRIVALALIVSGGYAAYRQAKPFIEEPSSSFERAQQLKAAGRFEDASNAFAQFAAAQRDHPSRADAEFEAACCLQLVPAPSFDEAQALKKRTLELFERFVAANPGHAKVARSKTRMGILLFDLGEYEQSIGLLQDPALTLADPESALPALRTLARARWKMGGYEESESAYLQAASLAGNYAPDQDYEELGDLDRWRAEHTQDATESERYRAAALENWTRAMRVSTTDPAAKEKIRKKCDWLSSQAAGKVAEGASTPAAVPEKEPPAAAEQPPQTPDPGVEAQYPGDPPASETLQAPAPPSGQGKDENAASSPS